MKTNFTDTVNYLSRIKLNIQVYFYSKESYSHLNKSWGKYVDAFLFGTNIVVSTSG